jgi:Domain of unknown function (DUF4157)
MSERERDADRAKRAARVPSRAASPRGALARLASTIGSSALARFAQAGSGLLPGGAVHGDVETAIATRRGGGRPLDAATRDRIGERLGDALTDVRVHDDAGASEIARSVSARAFATGTDVYFAAGEYRPGTSDGNRLIAHELTHVVQQRDAPTSGSLRVSEPGDALELEADAAAREIGGP